MNWSLIILGLVALTGVALAENSYLIIAPKLIKVGFENQLSVFIAAASQPVEVKFELLIGQQRIHGLTTVKAGETRNATLTIPKEFPVGAAELTITGTGGIRFEEKRDVIVYDNSYVLLVQTSASTYRPGDDMEMRLVATNEELMPLEKSLAEIEIYDANLKLVGEFRHVPIRGGISDTFVFPVAMHCNVGTWLVSATIGNTTSSVEVLVARPTTPSFDLKAIFQRFLLRTDKFLRGVIEIDDDNNQPIFGRAIVAIGQITEQDVQMMMKEQAEKRENMPSKQETMPVNEEWRKWKSQEMEIAGRVEINYDLMSLFNIDVTKVIAVQVYIQVTDLASGQERFIQHVIPVFTRDVVYDIRPLEFEAGFENEFEIIAKRPDGKPSKMEDVIVTISMMIGNEQGKIQNEKSVEIKDFYTRGRNDIAFFNVEIPENCIGVLMTITPLGEDGKVRGYRTHAVPLMPKPRRGVSGGKLSIELLPSMTSPVATDANAPVVSSQISTVGRTSNFYIQLVPAKSFKKFEPLPMSYVLLTNGRITRTGEFMIKPTKECQSMKRAIKTEEPSAPMCVFNGTLPMEITRDMVPYSTLLVYTFQPTLGLNVAESYRFSVAGLFQSTLTLNATIVPYTSTRTMLGGDRDESHEDFSSSEDVDLTSVPVSKLAQDKKRIELSFTGTPDSTVGLNVMEYDAIIQGLSTRMTKERVLQYLTSYEQVPIVGMPTLTPSTEGKMGMRKRQQTTGMEDTDRTETTTFSSNDDEHEHEHEHEHEQDTRAVLSEEGEERKMFEEYMGYKVRYPIEKMIFGVSSTRSSQSVEGDDVYTTSNMGRLYGDSQNQRSQSPYRRRAMKSSSQVDVSIEDNNYIVATSSPVVFKQPVGATPFKQEEQQQDKEDVDVEQQKESRRYGTPSWYEKMNSKLTSISQEAFTFMQSGLTIVSDFSSLNLPIEMRRTNLTKLFSQMRQRSFMDTESFGVRDEARQLLEEYLAESDLSMIPPPIMLEEQARTGYYRSLFFNTSRIESQGTGKVVLPRTKPYSTWIATGFALNAKKGLALAQPIRLPTNQGLYILGNFPDQVQVGERVLLTCGINNYLGKDLSKVTIRVRASGDFEIMEQSESQRATPSNGKDYTMTIPSLPSLGVATRHLILVPKRSGVVKIVLEVESEFGGDYEILTTYVRESGIERQEMTARLFDLTSDKKSYGPIVEKMTPSPFLRSIRVSVSGTGLDRLVERYTTETNSLIGVDMALIRLWRLTGLARYLNETSQMESMLAMQVAANISTAYQKLQLYNAYDGSFSFISDQGEQISSLYLTSFAFGALLSPFMTVRDNVTLNRTLSYILSRQQQDGSFDDEGSCFHYRFCSGEFRRESLTALVLYSMAHNNVSEYAPKFIHERLYMGEQSPMMRAQRFLESRLDAVKSCMLTTTLMQLALIQSPVLPEQTREKIFETIRTRQLTVVPEDGSRFFKYTDKKMMVEEDLLLNGMMISIYARFGDMKVATDIARWMVDRIETHPHYDTVLDAVFGTEAWLKTDCLFRQRFPTDKFSVMIDVSTDNGQKQQFKIDSTNMDITQKFRFTLPVNQITYSVSGFGVAAVIIRQVYVEKQQKQMGESMPFQLKNEFMSMPWISEITTRTCVTYTPTPKDQELAKNTFNRTVVVDVQLPSGMRVNLRQIGFFLSRVPEMMYFTFDERANKFNFFLTVPSTMYGKDICFEWCLERLSMIEQWAPIRIRAYDYLQPETQLVRLMPVEFQPKVLGYSYVDAVHKARPTMEQLTKMQQESMPSMKPMHS